MPYAFLADAVVVVHFGFVAFVAVGGFIAWRYQRVLIAHAPAIAWAAGIVTIGYSCPLTRLENDLRDRAGSGGYEVGFIDRYLAGVLYPAQYERFLQAVVAVGVIAAYLGLAMRRRGAVRRVRPPRRVEGRDPVPEPRSMSEGGGRGTSARALRLRHPGSPDHQP